MPREKEFEVDAALDLAMRKFWREGYEATSMSRLLEEMGIQKGSFYATFGSKRDVFLDSLRRYTEARFTAFESLVRRHSPMAALEAHLDAVAAEACGPDARHGCYLVNCALEVAPRDEDVQSLVQETFTAHRRFYARLFEAARDAGELAPEADPEELAGTLFGLVMGMRVLDRAGLPERVEEIRDRARDLLHRHRLQPTDRPDT